jgi:hypothetical protein
MEVHVTNSPAGVFHLKQEETLLGSIYITGIWDMFWYKVRLEPTEAFADIAPLFDRALQSLDDGGPADVNNIWDEIASRGVALIRRDDDVVINYFMLYLDGEDSRLRYVEPSDLTH